MREMVVIVHGFPNKQAALYFEWSWQNPHNSKPIRDIVSKIRGVGHRNLLKAKIRYLFEMMHVNPWNKFPLHIQWLTDKYHSDNLVNCPILPSYINVSIGTFEDLNMYDYDSSDEESEGIPHGNIYLTSVQK
eukprot:TRINITY_DN3833_c0_g1_i1.p1 TRINITY_DN3833_c0_g1~~TRINITY_DN3833_c0_g1_i1.p1  ORF type:complete len:132 (+),score=16.40 TRINITY_DN3833_c0_g1_i1:491-886(+)